MRTHYPRTPHLPWSPGASPDDVRSGELAGMLGQEVVVTEKLDGENTTLYPDGMHARSLDSAHHPSRAWVKALQGRIGALIPRGWRVCGENVYARHSLPYDDLESWFYGFSVWDADDRCLDWDSTVRFLRRLGVPTPPVLWRGTFDERVLRALRLDTARQEGYVVRTVEGFGRDEFGRRMAKWVRRGHVQTDTHWMHAAVVENGLGPAAALWAVRSGATVDVSALLSAVRIDPLCQGGPAHAARAEAAVADVYGRLDVLGRLGDARLAGVLAALLHRTRRGWLAPRLVAPLGMPLARRVADLVGLHPRLYRPFPDDERRAGLVRLAAAADLGVLHAVAGAVLAGRGAATEDEGERAEDTAASTAQPVDAAQAHEQVEWSGLHAEESGLLGPAPLEPLRARLRAALSGLDRDAADRCWSEARDHYAQGRISTAEEAVASTWRWRSGAFPRLFHLVGPSGSGKSTFARGIPGVDTSISLDDLRQARGSRADQKANPDVLREGLRRLGTALARGETVVWDATSLNAHQRSAVHTVARLHDTMTTHVVLLVDEDELVRRNGARTHPVPPDVLAGQLHRYGPPYPGQGHRTWYVGAGGTVDDSEGSLGGPRDPDGAGGPGGPDGLNSRNSLDSLDGKDGAFT